MKLAKKIMVAAIAVAAFGLMGCNPTALGDHGMINTNFSGAEVDGVKNENEETIRELALTAAKHSGGVWKLTQNVNYDATNSTYNKAGDGMMGVVFDVTKNPNGTFNFFVIGTARNNNTDATYISYFVNIDPAKLDSPNFGCEKKAASYIQIDAKKNKDKDEENSVPYEWVILDLQRGYLGTDIYNSETKEYSVQIAVTPKFANGEYTGDYVVDFYKADAVIELDDNKSVKTDATPIKTKTIEKIFEPKLANNDPMKSYRDLPQNQIGYYANIYPGQTLNARFDLPSKLTINEEVEE